MQKLTIINGPNQGRTLPLAEGHRLVVGRCASCDFPIMDPRMSRQHFALEEIGHVWIIRDLSSANGTWVNSCRVDQAVLHDADTITVGDTVLSVFLKPNGPQRHPHDVSSNQPHFKTPHSMRGTSPTHNE